MLASKETIDNMFAKPQSEHQWLDQLVGEWTFEHECQMPDGSTSNAPGKMTCRSLGGLWLICESRDTIEIIDVDH